MEYLALLNMVNQNYNPLDLNVMNYLDFKNYKKIAAFPNMNYRNKCSRQIYNLVPFCFRNLLPFLFLYPGHLSHVSDECYPVYSVFHNA